MEDVDPQDDYSTTDPVLVAESELRRLTKREREFEERIVAAQAALDHAKAAWRARPIDGPTMRNESAIGAADERVSGRGVGDALATISREREPAQHKLHGTHERTLDDTATIGLVICEIVDAVRALEQAAQRLAAALDGTLGITTQTGPLVAASLRVSTTSFVAEAAGVIHEIEAFKAPDTPQTPARAAGANDRP
jgi:hypothetical protein